LRLKPAHEHIEQPLAAGSCAMSPRRRATPRVDLFSYARLIASVVLNSRADRQAILGALAISARSSARSVLCQQRHEGRDDALARRFKEGWFRSP